MATFDTSKIDGFEAMTAEQRLDALLKAEIPDSVDLSKYVEKTIFDKKASEAASLSKQLKEKMTDDEVKKAEDAKVLTEMKEELEKLRKDKTVSEYTAHYISQGMDKKLAEETATALADGDMSKVFENQQKYQEDLKKKLKEEILNGTHKPDGNVGGKKDVETAAEEKAKELAKSRLGGGKEYDKTISYYTGKKA